MLLELRRLIRDAAPSAEETLKYGMPSYAINGSPFVHIAAAKSHVAVYGLVHVDGEVPSELAPYLHDRSTLRFKFADQLPVSALTSALERKANS
jgi:uncharacterized protein YdhG (YjbR/CyaY superfamily)